MSPALEPGIKVEKARIQVQVYPDAEGKLRWRIRSSKAGHRIVADSSESYSRKTDCFRGLLLVTGGRYTRIYRSQSLDGYFYEQGAILRRTPEGPVEDIFVEYTSPGGAE